MARIRSDKTEVDYYSTISQKIKNLKSEFPSLSDRDDDFVFTCLSIRNVFFKNPSKIFDKTFITNAIVDGKGDGGVDAIFTDSDSENQDMVLVQAKHYKTISTEDVRNALHKMVAFAKLMQIGKYEGINEKVSSRYCSVEAEKSDDAKTILVLFTSANRNGIKDNSCLKALGEDRNKFDIRIYFNKEICEEIKEREERRDSVERDKIQIDKTNNYLRYKDAIVVNASAYSIKRLYTQYRTNLLSSNLRYFIRSKIDADINKTINDSPNEFWYRNNGLTIVCEDYEVSGKEVHLRNFSIVNGGQTTKLLSDCDSVNEEEDFFLPCKIIKALGEDESARANFVYDIAKATNSQKPIKQIDLKSNAPEQLSFRTALRQEGVFYQTKRGEKIPSNYTDMNKHTSLDQVSKLCLAGIFQRPASSRNSSKKFFEDKFYNPIFLVRNSGRLERTAKAVKQLLKMSCYFDTDFVKNYEKECRELLGESSGVSLIPFARNSRTICIAFSSLAARIINKELVSTTVHEKFQHYDSETGYEDYILPYVANLDNSYNLFNPSVERDEDLFECVLSKLFTVIIEEGHRMFASDRDKDTSLTATNYLKKDHNYFKIIASEVAWKRLASTIREAAKLMEDKKTLV